MAACTQAPGAVVSAAEPLVSLLASAETSLSSFARELGFIGHVATDLFLLGQNKQSCLACLFKKVIFLNLILSSLHKPPKLFNVSHAKFSYLAGITISLIQVFSPILKKIACY